MGYSLLKKPTEGKRDDDYHEGVRYSSLIAISDDKMSMVLIFVSLTPIPTENDEIPGFKNVVFHELKFYVSLVPFYEEDGFPTEYFNGLHTRNILPPEVRKEILSSARELIGRIVTKVKPDAIVRYTHCRNPPEKALRKHERISETLLKIGYPLIRRGKMENGSIYWYHAKVVKLP